MNDDNGPPVTEPMVAENEDPNEDERQVEEPDLVTEESRGIERDQLLGRLTSKQPGGSNVCQRPLLKRRKTWNRGRRRHASTCLNCYTTRFSRKPLDPRKSAAFP